MSEQTHTPTPWMADGPMVSKAGTLICVADCEDLAKDMPDEEAEANAKFIVLACNSHDALLKSCKNLVEQFRTYQNGWMGQGVWRNRIGLEQDLADTEAAIKLAEEGQ